jgi:Protein of unknown function (DUF2889)
MTDSSTSTQASGWTRKPINHRKVDLMSYLRSDGLWDIEATLTDTRAYASTALERGNIAAGDPVHDIHVCVTLNDQMVVETARASMNTVPYGACPGALPAVERMAGAQVGPGWRRQIDQQLGNALGCTHIREMLLHIATMAYQTIPVWHAQATGDMVAGIDGAPPLHLGKCTAWAFDGPVVARHYPQFAKRNKP